MTRKWHQRSSIRALLATLLILLVTLGYPVLNALISHKRQGTDPAAVPTYPAGMPWDIQRSVDGQVVSVFGLSAGVSTLADARRVLGQDLQIAFLTPPNSAPVLEAYLDPLRTGPLTGKVILATDVDFSKVSNWIENSKKRQISETGAKINSPAEQDLPQVLMSTISSIHYLPSADLDEAAIVSRFGKPNSRLQSEPDLILLRYPEIGLMVTINQHGKELFQYVQPKRFTQFFPN